MIVENSHIKGYVLISVKFDNSDDLISRLVETLKTKYGLSIFARSHNEISFRVHRDYSRLSEVIIDFLDIDIEGE